jgi:hypothetical protein
MFCVMVQQLVLSYSVVIEQISWHNVLLRINRGVVADRQWPIVVWSN